MVRIWYENSITNDEMAEISMKIWYNYIIQSSLFAVGKEQKC